MRLISHLRRLPVLRRFRAPPTVAVVRLGGVIGTVGPLRSGMSLAGMAEPLERAFRMPDISAVALVVNSPGGSPVQSALIAKRIRDLADEKNLKVYAFCEDVAASGGYWLACAADEVYATDNSIIGSIGVVSASFGFNEFIRRYGIERRIYTSGDKKVILDPFKEEDPDEVARLKALQLEIHENFKRMVRERRGTRLKASEELLFSGEFWTGRKARELGLVDGLGEPHGTLRKAYGQKVRLKPVAIRRSWLRRYGSFGAEARGLALPEGWACDIIAAVEERALWGRYGL